MSKRLIIAGALVAFVLGGVGLHAVGSLLCRPFPARVGAPPAELRAETVAFPSASGSTIDGWLARGRPRGGAVLLLPGVRANRLSMVDRARFLHAAGYSTLLIDFQATGESPGDAITFGWLERLDVLAAVRELERRLPDEPIGILGTSVGGAATLLAATELDVQAVAVEAVYPTLDAAVKNRLRMRLGAAGAALAPALLLQLRPRLGLRLADLRPVDRIALLRCPVLIVGGTADRHTTVAETLALHAAARELKELWLVEGAAHVDLHRHAGEPYRQRVLEFFGRTLRNETASLTTHPPVPD